MWVGLDDTDAVNGMCTTYLASLLAEKLGVRGYVRLIRLNPNIPYKTRGNGALAFETDTPAKETKDTVLRYVKEYSRFTSKKTNPGVVFIEKPSPKNKKALAEFYRRAVSELVTIEDAETVAHSVDAEVHKFKNGRGIIGALAAIGADLPDKTYELIAYRKEKKKEKRIERESVLRMDKETYPETFNNVDPATGRILITPHGVDPVFCGIRGNTPEIVEKAWKMLKPLDEIERTQLFVSNQGTDAHLRERKIGELKLYDCATLEGVVSAPPRTIAGGHVLFAFSDGTGTIDCAAYKPTEDFRNDVKKLVPGDRLRAYGGISRHPKTLNLEKIEILELQKVFLKDAPLCCGKKMSSAGRGKGGKCKKCGRKIRDMPEKEIPRDICTGFYEVPQGAKRHLSMPLIRMKCRADRNTGKEQDILS
ncbi:MAG: tRNA(Ile)(2)-agmatinylcytidine synthase [Candidatus Altiarchaeia archaeon]